jgi:hypothetical protein
LGSCGKPHSYPFLSAFWVFGLALASLPKQRT